MKKEVRHQKILELIADKSISTQLDLLNGLKELGINTTQATLSRDIKELRLVKQADLTGELSYRILDANEEFEYENNPIRDIFQESVIDITQVQFINIIKTQPNDGNRVAAVVDDAGIESIKGTLAGFDTLVIFSEDSIQAEQLHDQLKSFLID